MTQLTTLPATASTEDILAVIHQDGAVVIRDLIASSEVDRVFDETRPYIDYAFRPRLRSRLTLRRLTLRRNPWTFGDSVSHTVYRYSCQHSHFRYLQESSRISIHRLTERSATARARHEPAASAHGLSPVTLSARQSLFRPVSCYAFFK